MSVPHQLADEIQGLTPIIERLSRDNYEFGRLAAAYDEVNREIWRVETIERFTADEVLENLKKRRLLLRDDIALLLAREQARVR